MQAGVTAPVRQDAPKPRRNFLLGVANGALGRAGMGFVNPNLVLAAFIYEQTKSKFLVGLLATLWAAGVLGPQLLVSSRIEHHPRKKQFYKRAVAARVLALASLVVAIWLTGTYGSPWLLGLFFLSYLCFAGAVGCGTPPFLDIVGRTIVPQRLGSFFAWRSLCGEILAISAGFGIVLRIQREVASPLNYTILGAIGLGLLVCAWTMFMLVAEEHNESPPRRRGFRETFKTAVRAVNEDGNYKRLLWHRVLFRVNALSVAFYVPYGVERLGAVQLSGVFIGCLAFSRLSSSLLWGRLSDRKGNRLCLIAGAALFTISPVAVLLAPHLSNGLEGLIAELVAALGLSPILDLLSLSFLSSAFQPNMLTAALQWTIGSVGVTLDPPLCVYLLSLVLFGFGLEANMIGTNGFLIESAPADRRPSYIAFLNSVTFPLVLLPAVAGVLVGVHRWGLDILFIVIAVSGLATLLNSRRLREVRAAPAA